ncbi:MAG: MoaD/ThiS family protein [Negativicutes bacterium]|nr:MoaD/ThiS family protein [Negativicutes bacterium]
MTVTVKLTSSLAVMAEGRKQISINFDQWGLLGSLLGLLVAQYPRLKRDAGIEEGALPDHINIYHNGDNVRYLQGLETPLGEGDVVQIIPAEAAG